MFVKDIFTVPKEPVSNESWSFNTDPKLHDVVDMFCVSLHNLLDY